MKKYVLFVLATFALAAPAIAADIHFQPVKKVFNWNGATPATTDAIVSVPSYESRIVVTQEFAQCRPMSCAAQLPGRFDAWLGLFTANERERPAILNRVLLGMSPEVSALIVQSGYLRRMPPNWQALQTEMMNAQNHLYSQGYFFNFMSAIFEVNGLANAVALGYADVNACASAPSYSCSAPNMKRENRPLSPYQRRVHFEVSGALLLPYELESVALRIAGPGEPITVLSGDFDTRLTNQYEMRYEEGTDGELNVFLRFLSRPMRAVPSNLIVTNALAKVAGGLKFDVSLDPNKIAAVMGRGGRFEGQFTLCRRDVLGGCAETVASSAGDLTSGRFSTVFSSSLLRPGKKYHVAVKIRAIGTPYFSSDFSDKEKSNKVDHD